MTASKTRRPKLKSLLYATAAAAVTLAVGTANSQAAGVVKVAFSADYYPSTPQMLAQWMVQIAQGSAKKFNGLQVVAEPIHGGFDDFITKLSLMYGNPSTAPDLAIVPGQEVGQWESSGLLAKLDPYLKTTDWWSQFVPAIQNEGRLNGSTYYVSMGDGDNALLYDKTIFAKSGLPADWKPKNWEDILAAARQIKKADPSVWPLWVITGTAQGSEGVVLGSANLLVASSTPYAYDNGTKKWVADSPGVREVINFYKEASAEGVLAPPSEILDPNAPGIVGPFLPKHKIGITLAANYVPTLFNQQICGPCWPQAGEQIGFAPIPTSHGQAPGLGSTLSGWGLIMNASSKDLASTWKVFNYMMEKDNLINQDNLGGLVPPIVAYNTDPVYVNFAPAFQTPFGQLVNNSTVFPPLPDFKVWAFALAQATETVVLHPNTSVDTAAAGMKAYIANQLDDSQVEVLK
jgi:multiple sugar transport system substrate-binding protein